MRFTFRLLASLLALSVLTACPADDRAPGQEIEVELTEWDVRLSSDTVDAGPVSFRVRNEGGTTHALRVVGEGVDERTENLDIFEETVLTVDLPPGDFALYCPVEDAEDHRQRGMQTSLHVRGD